MRMWGRAAGTAAAAISLGMSQAALAQEGCTELRTQYQRIETLGARPMSLLDLQHAASDIGGLAVDVQTLEGIPYQRMSEEQRANYREELEALQRMAAILGVGCDARMTGSQCARNVADLSQLALQLAMPARYESWRYEDLLEKVTATTDEQAIRLHAQSVGVACPGAGSCRSYLIAQLEAKGARAGALDLLDTATSDAARTDARRPLFERIKAQLLEQMGELRCGEGPEPAAPVAVARVAPRDYPPQPAPAARPVPVGGPVLEMDPSRPPEPTPRDANWITVSPGRMAYSSPVLNGTYEWSELPQSIGPEGTLITLTVSGRATAGNGWATGIQIRGQGVTITSPGGLPIDGDLPLNLERNGSGDRSITVKVTPQNNAVGSGAMILVGAFYGAQVRYYYKVVRSADR